MPWNIVEKDGQFCLQKKGTDTIVKGSCHKSKADTMAMMRALYANMPEARKTTSEVNQMDAEFLTISGGEVKSQSNGTLGGYLIRWGDETNPDLVGDFFTPETDFGFEGTKRSPVYLHHRRPFKARNGKTLRVREKIGEAELTKDDNGILIEAILYNSDKYRAALSRMGWSSGTAGHLVDREPAGKAFRILTWPLGLDASLTWEPCEPRNTCIPLKSIGIDEEMAADATEEEFIKSLDDDMPSSEELLAGLPAINRYCKAVSPSSQQNGTQRSEAAADAVKEYAAIAAIIGEALYSDQARLVRRSEHRFLKSGREIDGATLTQVEELIAQIEKVETATSNVKAALAGIQRLSQLSQLAKQAVNEKARLEMWNFCQITGTLPEELENE